MRVTFDDQVPGFLSFSSWQRVSAWPLLQIICALVCEVWRDLPRDFCML